MGSHQRGLNDIISPAQSENLAGIFDAPNEGRLEEKAPNARVSGFFMEAPVRTSGEASRFKEVQVGDV